MTANIASSMAIMKIPITAMNRGWLTTCLKGAAGIKGGRRLEDFGKWRGKSENGKPDSLAIGDEKKSSSILQSTVSEETRVVWQRSVRIISARRWKFGGFASFQIHDDLFKCCFFNQIFEHRVHDPDWSCVLYVNDGYLWSGLEVLEDDVALPVGVAPDEDANAGRWVGHGAADLE